MGKGRCVLVSRRRLSYSRGFVDLPLVREEGTQGFFAFGEKQSGCLRVYVFSFSLYGQITKTRKSHIIRLSIIPSTLYSWV